jgi:hypothetical protein
MSKDTDDGDYQIWNVSIFTLNLDADTTTNGTTNGTQNTLPAGDYTPSLIYLGGAIIGGVVLVIVIGFIFVKKPGRRGKIVAVILAILAVSGMGISSWSYLNFVPTAVDPPIHLHLTWQKTTTNDTMTAMWQTNSSASGDLVLYDTVSRGGNPVGYTMSAAGSNFTYSGASGYIHVVELEDLSPDTVYYFVAGGPAGGYSQEYKFRTGPAGVVDTTFIAGADSRTHWDKRDAMSALVSNFDVDFILFNGDFVGDGWNQTQWDSYFDHVEQYFYASDGRFVPIIPAIGNHEDNDSKYYNQWAVGGNEQWYSIDWGNIHIAVIDCQETLAKIQQQATWLDADLAAHADAEWTIVMYHFSTFATGRKPNWVNGINHIVPVIDKHHVDIVIGADSHGYFRSGPVNYTASSSTQQDSFDEGTLYVVTAGWGAPLYNTPAQWWTNYTASVYNFVVFDVFTNNSLHLKAIDINGTVFDDLWIRH